MMLGAVALQNYNASLVLYRHKHKGSYTKTEIGITHMCLCVGYLWRHLWLDTGLISVEAKDKWVAP